MLNLLLNSYFINNFSGSLSLVDLGSVNVTSRNVMTAVAALCNRPTAVSFFKLNYLDEFPDRDNLDCTCEECLSQFWDSECSDDENPPRRYCGSKYRAPDIKITKDDLRSTLQMDWPKV